MTDPQMRLWSAIAIEPVKWEQHPFGDEGGGFWVVAIVGASVIWYNDRDEGFNRLLQSDHGEVLAHGQSEQDLGWTMGFEPTTTGITNPSQSPSASGNVRKIRRLGSPRMENRSGSGYSGTSLAKKLGIKEAHRVLLVNAPKEYKTLLGPLSESVKFIRRADATVDVAHIFTTQREDLSKHLVALRQTLRHDAALWISWPKIASKVPSTVTEDTIRELALPLGFVDIKVCAITEIWSGLKLVVRKELR